MAGFASPNLFQRLDTIYEWISQDDIEKAMKELLSLVSDFSSDRQHLRLAIGLSSDYYILRKDQADQTLSPEEESRREKELIRRLHALLNRLETELGKDHQAA